MTKKILISTGDYSGKIYGAKLIEELLKAKSDIEIYTTFKSDIKDNRVHTVCSLADYGIVGISEVLPSLLYYYLELQKLKGFIKDKKIDILIPIDFPDFNFKLIAFARNTGTKVIYYVPPQLWAWRFDRINFLKKYTQTCLVTFKFEKELYSKEGLNCHFVGHPIIDILAPLTNTTVEVTYQSTKNHKAICFFPGSRTPTVKILLPLYLQLCELIYCQFPNRPFIFGILNHISDKLLKKYKFTYPFKIQKINSARELFPQCSLAIIPTGTISLEAALCKIPSIVVNKTNYINYLLVKDKIKLQFLSLPNILAKEEIFPEFLQTRIDTEKILQTAEDFLDYPEKWNPRFSKWDQVQKQEFNYSNPVQKATSIILQYL